MYLVDTVHRHRVINHYIFLWIHRRLNKYTNITFSCSFGTYKYIHCNCINLLKECIVLQDECRSNLIVQTRLSCLRPSSAVGESNHIRCSEKSMNDQSKLQNVDMHLICDHVATGMRLAATNFPVLQLSDLQCCGPDVHNDKLPGKIKSQLLCIGTTHIKMSQLVNKMFLQQACIESLSTSCNKLSFSQVANNVVTHNVLTIKLLNCRTITSCCTICNKPVEFNNVVASCQSTSCWQLVNKLGISSANTSW
jgi:hypothetical protein